jgi:hypothetical protein
VSLTTPWTLAFETGKKSDVSLVFDIFVDLCFTMDIFVIFNSAFVDERQTLVDDRKVSVFTSQCF